MDRSLKRKLAAGAVAGLALAGGGAAFAATQLGSPSTESQAIINDAAEQLGIQPSKLSDALKNALKNRVDAAVADGRLTKEQGEALKQRIEADDYPLIFPGPAGFHGPHGFGVRLETAATYLGLTEAELRTQLESGKTLAEVAKDHGKSVDGLVDALYEAAKTNLDEAVAGGRLTKEQEEQILSDLRQRITDLVNGQHPGPFREGLGPDRFGGFRAGGVRDGAYAFSLPAA
jgi:polyhydroxyalkanoate synthesis regulator phasin